MNNLSLMTIMRDDPEFGRRIQKKTQEIKQDTENINKLATEYSKQYQQEIAEGTELRNRLLTEGTSKGLSEEQIMASYGRFVPTVRTPILNMLFFLLRESDNDPRYGRTLYQKRDAINEYLIQNKKLGESKSDVGGDLTEDEASKILDDFVNETFAPTSSTVRKQVNTVFNDEKLSRTTEDMVKVKEPQNMEEFLYGNLTLEQFDVLKKLKRLAKSENKHEAFLAWSKCSELCEKHGLDINRIPC